MPRNVWIIPTHVEPVLDVPVPIVPDQWFQPVQQPPRKAAFVFAAIFASGLTFVGEPSDFISTPEVSSWYVQTAEPVRPAASLPVALQSFYAVDPTTPPPVPDMTGWFVQTGEPVRPAKVLPLAARPISTGDPAPVIVSTIPEVTSWFVQTGEPPKGLAPLQVANYQHHAIDPTALLIQAEAPQLDKWWRPANEPPKPLPSNFAAVYVSGMTYVPETTLFGTVATFTGVEATFTLGTLVGKKIGWTDVTLPGAPVFTDVTLPADPAWTDVDTTTSTDYDDV